MNHVTLATGQTVDLTAGAQARARQLRAVVAHRHGFVGVSAKHGRPVYRGRMSGAGVVHGHR